MKTLVLVFHPDMSSSRVNRFLAARAETLGDDVTVRSMYDLYPDQKVDVAAEQAALEAADRVVLQFPLYWYSTPALLKQWEDDVLLYGWAYGSTGNALAGKELLVAVSTGGAGDAYSREASYGYTITELLRPLQATANMVQMGRGLRGHAGEQGPAHPGASRLSAPARSFLTPEGPGPANRPGALGASRVSLSRRRPGP